ncbi:hypothetical protein AURDEDRAFT_174269 [Auricularia subglabra TFB-10046 SS5]|uniref:Uncharacterized protein n=1 Tax=Auricularia subglabra (strain TFB-10046 / SS5) TaxID=717982 RepID=J0LGG1_AURST|nr:hypothetical protein AURDEDRAFT_174269 [Auricularia subglabra TFB-10046 SS5]
MHFATFIVAAVLAAGLPAQAFIAWSGDACDGDQGADVACDGSCFPFGGRHSFVAGDGNHCVALFRDGDCVGQRFNFTNQGDGCTNVNTGTDIESFRCFAGPSCA